MRFRIVNFVCLLFLVLLLIFCWQFEFSFFVLIIPFFVWITLTSLGVFEIRLNYFLKAYHQQKNSQQKIISLTFDDGPTEFTPRILDILEKNHAKATFFCIGKQIEKYPEILRNASNLEHVIGNHTFHHSSKNGFYSSQKIVEEISSTNEIIFDTINLKPKLFRPPFGITNPHIADAISQTKHDVIGWSLRSLDTIIDDEQKLFDRISSKIKPGCIILMHDTSDKTANVLEQLFVFLQKENYKVVPLDELLKIDVYEN